MQKIIDALEQNYLLIKKEYEAAPEGMFRGWKERYLFNEGWNVLGLRFKGTDLREGHEQCPILSKIILEFSDVIDTCGFSVLNPNTIISPHVGYTDTVLRCHLGLQIPEGDTALKVDGQIIKWQEGKAFTFDDTLLHEAWNNTEQKRSVVLLDLKK